MTVKTTRLSIICKAIFVLIASIVLSTNALADVIIDNGDSGTSSTGTWTVSGGSNSYGTNSLFARPSATYTWQFSGQPAGEYEVLMWWTSYFSRGTNITVDINAVATSSVSVNQQENGGQWNSLGIFTFGSSGSVTITASSDMLPDGSKTVSTCADAVQFRKVSGNSSPTAIIDSISPNPATSGVAVSFNGHGEDSDGTIAAYSWTSDLDGQLGSKASFSTSGLSIGTHEISFRVQDDQGDWSTVSTQILTVSDPLVDFIIDNGDSGTSSTGTWTVSGGSNSYGTNSLFARPSATYTWQFSGQPAGEYEVLMWWTSYFSRGTNIAVDINAVATSSVTVNQQENGGQWNSLGIFTFGTSGSVTITASSDMLPDGSKTVSTCADAIRFRKINDGTGSGGGSGLGPDLVIQDVTISDTRAYDSDAGIVFDNVLMTATADVLAASTFELLLKPGTHIAQGARFVARMKDNDGLSNRCEMQYFGNLNQDPDDDFDGDGYTNLQECQVGADPSFPGEDTDSDGLPDFWEMQHFGNLDQDCNSDSNGDGVYDCIEYQLGRDPNATGSKGPGIYYQYDELGRIRKIERIPSR